MHKAFVSCNIEHSPATTALRMVAYSLLYTGAMLMVVSKRNRDKFRRYTQILAAWAVVQLVVLVLATRAYQSCTHPGNCVMIPGFVNSNWWMFIVAPVGLPVAIWFVYVEEGRSLASVGYMMAFFLTQFAAFQGEKSLIPLVVKKESTIGEQMLVRLVLHPFLWETTLFLGRFCIRQFRNFNYDVGTADLGVLQSRRCAAGGLGHTVAEALAGRCDRKWTTKCPPGVRGPGHHGARETTAPPQGEGKNVRE